MNQAIDPQPVEFDLREILLAARAKLEVAWRLARGRAGRRSFRRSSR
jgi:hypothetical protein